MIEAVGANTNLYTSKCKSKSSISSEKAEATKTICSTDTKKQIETMKKEIANRLDEMHIDKEVTKLNVHMSDAFLESCLKDPQKLENAMKNLEEFFNTPTDNENGPNRSYVFLVMGDRTQTISTTKLREGNFKNTGMYWEKDFISYKANAMKTLEDAAAKNMKLMEKKLADDLMYRNLKAWAYAESKI